ncbi:hypothetical protein B0H11DRAFT_1899919 [Mycena galericulata]|nr:hypothetical protein B0H11DRAFT_1899919 [Mycena galericulata]
MPHHRPTLPGLTFCFPTPPALHERAIVKTNDVVVLEPEDVPRSMWLRPHCFLAVVITSRTERTAVSTYERLRALPLNFVRNRVRHLCLEGINTPRTMMDTCPDIVDLSLRPAHWGYFPFLEVMCLQRLATNIRALLDDFKYEPLTHSVFATVTHLTLFDDVSCCTWDDWRDLQALPALTHLCLGGEIAYPLLHGALEHCETLHILLNRWRDLEEIQPQDYCAAAGVTDPRFVMLETGTWVYEWQLSAHGGFDMWDRAKDFIAGKRDGVIPKTQFWLTAGFWEEALDPHLRSDCEDGESSATETDSECGSNTSGT